MSFFFVFAVSPAGAGSQREEETSRQQLSIWRLAARQLLQTFSPIPDKNNELRYTTRKMLPTILLHGCCLSNTMSWCTPGTCILLVCFLLPSLSRCAHTQYVSTVRPVIAAYTRLCEVKVWAWTWVDRDFFGWSHFPLSYRFYRIVP